MFGDNDMLVRKISVIKVAFILTCDKRRITSDVRHEKRRCLKLFRTCLMWRDMKKGGVILADLNDARCSPYSLHEDLRGSFSMDVSIVDL